VSSSSPPVYDTIGRSYAAHRRPDPRWAALVAEHVAAGPLDLVVNVGAGTGSYEPEHCAVLAVEPSTVMLEQRPAGAAPVVQARAAALPLPSDCAGVALAVLTVHHWQDWEAGLAELCRVAPRRVVLAIDFEMHSRFWLLDEYLPAVGEYVRSRRPGCDVIAAAIGAEVVIPLGVARDMEDGVMGAFWCRPEAYLDPGVRANASGLALADPAVVARGIERLRWDLDSGAWQARHADLSTLDSIDLGYRLLVAGGPA
jgi:SAM-dependent methyltransferase